MQAAESFGGRASGRVLQLNAMENRVFDVELEDESHLVVKFYRPGRWKAETIQDEHDFLQACLNDEIPVVTPVAGKDGKTVQRWEDIYFAAFPKTQGRLEPELMPTQLQRLGRYLARLHNIGESFRDTTRLRLDAQTYGFGALADLKTTGLLPIEFASRYEDLVVKISQIAEARLKPLPYILLHGDCHVGNILWRGDAPFFIDFDDCLYAPAVQDLWLLTGGDDEYGQKARETLLDAYEEIREFDHNTLSLIPILRAMRMIHFSTWIAKRWDDASFKRAFPQFTNFKYWAEQVESLGILAEQIQQAALR